MCIYVTRWGDGATLLENLYIYFVVIRLVSRLEEGGVKNKHRFRHLVVDLLRSHADGTIYRIIYQVLGLNLVFD